MILVVAGLVHTLFCYYIWAHKLVATQRVYYVEQQYIRFECKLNSNDIISSSILQVICPPPCSARLLNVNVEVYSTIEAFDTLFT